MDSYFTVKGYDREELSIKKSKFIVSVTKVETEAKAWEFIKAVKDEFSDATHNVFAYRIGHDGKTEKQNDDGEPGGTAGKPVLDVIKMEELTDTVVVVTRYFGGTYLGAGGLIRAYSTAAKEGIKKAGKSKKNLHKKLKFEIDYSFWGKLQNELNNTNVTVKETNFEENVTLTVLVPWSKTDYIKEFVIDLTGGKGEVQELGELFI